MNSTLELSSEFYFRFERSALLISSFSAIIAWFSLQWTKDDDYLEST